MSLIDKFLDEVSYKFPKGYPDVTNKDEYKMLLKLFEQRFLTKEGSEEEIYDIVIKKALGEDQIPIPKGEYVFEDSTFEIDVASEDKEIFSKLYNISPPKKGETEGGTKGVGNGEVALYWLYNFSQNPTKVTVGRSGDDPDLYFNNVGVEVKSYSSHNTKLSLGRFGMDKENLQLLSIVFGIKALSELLGSKQSAPALNPTNFKGTDLVLAFEKVLELKEIEHLDMLAKQYEIFETIQKNLAVVDKILENPKDKEEASQNLAYKILSTKLSRKPGNGGYLANVLKSGNIKFFKIDFEKLQNNEKMLENFIVHQSTIQIHFNNMF